MSPAAQHPDPPKHDGPQGSLPNIFRLVVGVGFAAAAVFNVTTLLPRSRQILDQFADDSWVPAYRRALRTLQPQASAVIAGVVGYEALVAGLLLSGRCTRGALRSTQTFTLSLVPALTWPYWPVNVLYSVAVEILLRSHPARRSRP